MSALFIKTGRAKWVWVILLLITWFLLFPVQQVRAQDEKPVMSFFLLSGDTTVTAGENLTVVAELSNNGQVPLNHITFSYLAPTGWIINYTTDGIETLKPGDYQFIQVKISPPKSAIEKNNNVTLIAQSDEARQVLTVYVRLEPAIGVWLWLGIGLAVIFIAVFVFLYWRLNRQK